MPEFDTRSEYDHYFAEIGARSDSAVASTLVQGFLVRLRFLHGPVSNSG